MAKEIMFDDPEPFDEDDPENKLEMFEMYKDDNLKPEDLPGATRKYRKEYADWLKTQDQ